MEETIKLSDDRVKETIKLSDDQVNHFVKETIKLSDDQVNHFVKETIKLSDDQLNASKLIFNFLNKEIKNLTDDEYVFYLFGVAGSGKTTLVTEIVKYISKQNKYSIHCCAPTNQAVNILKSKFMVNKEVFVRSSTIHALLHVSADLNVDDGEKVFILPKKHVTIFTTNKSYLVIIDECSMISHDMAKYILESFKKEMEQSIDLKTKLYQKQIKILFLGDQAQLPPVNEPVNILINKNSKENTYSLKQIMRTSNTNIHDISNHIRKWQTMKGALSIIKYKGVGVNFYHNQSDTIKSKWFSNFVEKCLKKNDTTFIILVWTNKVCKYYNELVRDYLFPGKKKQFMAGDYIIFKEHYVTEDATPFYTSEQAKIIEVKETEHCCRFLDVYKTKFGANIYLKLTNGLDEPKFDVWKLVVKKKSMVDEDSCHEIFILMERATTKMKKFKHGIEKNIRNIITQNYYDLTDEKNNKAVKDLWQFMNDICSTPFADVLYGYCMTVHKSQASTFGRVYVDLTNILLNDNVDEAKRCLYTAVTRTSQHLSIII